MASWFSVRGIAGKIYSAVSGVVQRVVDLLTAPTPPPEFTPGPTAISQPRTPFQLTDTSTYRTGSSDMLRGYSYATKTTMVNSVTGDTKTQFITVSSNEILTSDQVRSTAIFYALTGNYGTFDAVSDIEITDASRSEALGEL